MNHSIFPALLGLATTMALAHPHFGKTLTVVLPGEVEATIFYRTIPSNEQHTREAEVGSFLTPRRPALTLKGNVQAGSVSLAAGKYTIGVIKESASRWSMVLLPGHLQRDETPDLSRLIKLDSRYSAHSSRADHLLVDITPGHGDFEGKAVLTLHCGSMFLQAILAG